MARSRKPRRRKPRPLHLSVVGGTVLLRNAHGEIIHCQTPGEPSAPEGEKPTATPMPTPAADDPQEPRQVPCSSCSQCQVEDVPANRYTFPAHPRAIVLCESCAALHRRYGAEPVEELRRRATESSSAP